MSVHLEESDRRVGGFIHGLDVEEILFCLLDALQQTPSKEALHAKNTSSVRSLTRTSSETLSSACVLADIRLLPPQRPCSSTSSFASFSGHHPFNSTVSRENVYSSLSSPYTDTRKKVLEKSNQKNGTFVFARRREQEQEKEFEPLAGLETNHGEDTVAQTLWGYSQQHLGLVILSLRSFLEVRATSREHQISLFRVLLRALALWVFRKRLRQEGQVSARRASSSLNAKGVHWGGSGPGADERASAFGAGENGDQAGEEEDSQRKEARQRANQWQKKGDSSGGSTSVRGVPSLATPQRSAGPVAAWEREWVVFAFAEYPLLKPLDERKICMALVVLMIAAIHPKYVVQKKFIKELKKASKTDSQLRLSGAVRREGQLG